MLGLGFVTFYVSLSPGRKGHIKCGKLGLVLGPVRVRVKVRVVVRVLSHDA